MEEALKMSDLPMIAELVAEKILLNPAIEVKIQAAVEAATNHLTTGSAPAIDIATLTSQVTERLISDQRFLRSLGAEISKGRRSAADNKKQAIAEIVAEIRGGEMTANDVSTELVEDLYRQRVTTDRQDTWPSKIKAALEERQQKTTETIQSLLLKKHKNTNVSKFAWRLVDMAVPPDNVNAVREALTEEDEDNEIVPMLRQS
ncbi:MAG: hypothetical protein WCV58_03295 [Patescibacteria group bacterium]|jgi:polyhydroxyalkanoate synthesis regulator phasin